MTKNLIDENRAIAARYSPRYSNKSIFTRNANELERLSRIEDAAIDVCNTFGVVFDNTSDEAAQTDWRKEFQQAVSALRETIVKKDHR